MTCTEQAAQCLKRASDAEAAWCPQQVLPKIVRSERHGRPTAGLRGLGKGLVRLHYTFPVIRRSIAESTIENATTPAAIREECAPPAVDAAPCSEVLRSGEGGAEYRRASDDTSLFVERRW